MSKGIRIVLISCLALVSAAAMGNEKIYRWVDSEGNVQFGDRPPAGVEATIVTPAYASGGLGLQSQPKPTEQESAEQELSPAELQRQERAEQRRKAWEDRQRLEENCAAMRRQRDEMEPRPHVIVQGEDGEPVRLDDEVRLAKLAEAKAYLAEHCD